jgi:hypothetical protein
MALNFIDFQEFGDILEICIVHDPFVNTQYFIHKSDLPYEWNEFDDAIYCALPYKIVAIERMYPKMKLIPFSEPQLRPVPSNISCMWMEHGPCCAYKRALSMCVEYFYHK